MDTDEKTKLSAKFGTRHVQIIIMSLCLMIAYGMRISISVAVVAMTDVNATDSSHKKYDWGSREKSMIFSSFLWGYAISLIPSGYLATIWSAQKLFSIAVFTSGIITAVTPLLAEYGGWEAVCVSRIAIGLAQAGFLPCLHVLVSNWAPPHERSRMSTISSNAANLGTVLGMALPGVIAASDFDWPGIFYVFGISSVLASILFYFKVFDSPICHPTIDIEEKTYISNSLLHLCEEMPSVPWKKIFTSIPMWALIVVHTGNNWGAITFQTEIPAYMKSALNFDIVNSGLISALPYLICWLSSFPWSWLADYAIHRNLSVLNVRRIFNIVGLWIPALFLVALSFVDTINQTWPVIILCLYMATHSAISSGFNVNHIDLSPNFAGTMYGISNCASAIIGTLSPLLTGFIVQDKTDTYGWHIVFYVTASIFFVTNLIFIIFASGKTQAWNSPVNKKISVLSIYSPTISIET